jgi:phage-related protein (TIGR01555 family)
MATRKPRRGPGNPNWKSGGPSPNPAGRGARKTDRLDGWANILTGFGTSRDKRRGATLDVEPLSHEEQRALWRGDDIAARIVETVPAEMFREGYEIKFADKEAVERVKAEDKRLRVRARFKRAKEYERAYGGAAIFPIINDGAKNLATPLNAKAITKIKHLRVLEPRELRVHSFDEDINSETFGEPLTYYYTPAGGRGASSANTIIHRSRLIIFTGKRVTNDPNEVAPMVGWGDSVLTAIHEVLRDFGIAWSTAALLLVDFSQGVYSMDNLADMIAAGKDQLVLKRLQTMDAAKSVIKAIVIDAKDKYERQQTPISGLPDSLDRFSSRMAAAGRLPVTVMMGQSPKGLGNEGDSDVRFLYDQIATEQDDTLPMLEQMLRLILLQIDGPTKGKEPDAWSVEFCPLWQPTEKEKAETRKIVVDTFVAEIQNGIVSTEEVRKTLHGGDAWSMDLHVDVEADKKLKVEAERAAQMEEDLRTPMGADPGGAKLADTAMNGAQITSLLEVVKAFNLGEITEGSAKAILVRGFRVSTQEADEMIDEEGARKMQAERKQQAAAIAAGAGPQPPQPGAPKPGQPAAPKPVAPAPTPNEKPEPAPNADA